jgi:hypothetical protein
MENQKENDVILLIYFFPAAIGAVLFALTIFLNGCTLSFQNISTHGQATDLIDETQDANADVSPEIHGVPI